MPGDLNLLVAFAAFIGSAAIVIGGGLFLLVLLLRARAKQRNRLARVSRRRISGQLDLDETRLQAIKRQDEASPVLKLTDAVARFVPVLDTARLKANIRRGRLKLTVAGFVAIALASGLIIAALATLATGFDLFLLLVPSTYAGMLATHAAVRMRGEAMSERLMKQLPNALDTIIRGIRAGLPVLECIASVGKEFEDPIGAHFRTISERVQLGESLDAALWRLAKVVDRPEVDFLAISISIQMETGGSLAEALGNLADLLRKRDAMKLKIRAISSEAKASAMIIGALPFVMLGLLTVMSPDYIMPLFTDPRGQIMLLVGLASISAGSFVMWRMTKFEI